FDLTESAGQTYSTLYTGGALDLTGVTAGGITIEVVSANANTAGLLFDPFYDFKFLEAVSVSGLGAGLNISDLFTIDTTGLKYATGSNSVAAQYNGQSLSELIKVYTVTSGGNTVLMMSIPEPSTYGLALGALALAAVAIRRRKQKKSVA
ncbi:MAG: PEP-CTERM sorting domain-containing protein, partial [Opitutales bacterium]|nr:PEP-CTERM sorting domain-containing protein [Opitutales bacterium]